jgi:hypothetical protein
LGQVAHAIRASPRVGWIRQDVYRRRQNTFVSRDVNRGAPIARALERVQSAPVVKQRLGLQDEHFDWNLVLLGASSTSGDHGQHGGA